ncbi:MAG: redoxin domain-containing protein [Caldithrix sp.]|nr:redoxin domain-containing protein [Caldithrix sp.]
MKLIYKILVTLILINLLYGGDVIEPGSKAPDFVLKDAQGKNHRLSDYRGHMVVLFFYPKDDTPGCIAEVCNLRDNFEILSHKGFKILGISYDDMESHQKFKSKHDLPFTLLSDTDKQVSELYGAKSGLMGYFFAKRITYLIDPQGIILHRFDNVKSRSHTAQILDWLESYRTNN